MSTASDKIVLEFPGDLITPKAAAEILGVTPTTVLRWLKEGRIPGYRLFREYRVSRAEVVRFMKPVPIKASRPERMDANARQLDVLKAYAKEKGIL